MHVDTKYRIDIQSVWGYNYVFFQNSCGYLRFFPLSGVSQAHLGSRISLRFTTSDLRKKGLIQIVLLDIFFLTCKKKKPGSVGAVPIPSFLFPC